MHLWVVLDPYHVDGKNDRGPYHSGPQSTIVMGSGAEDEDSEVIDLTSPEASEAEDGNTIDSRPGTSMSFAIDE